MTPTSPRTARLGRARATSRRGVDVQRMRKYAVESLDAWSEPVDFAEHMAALGRWARRVAEMTARPPVRPEGIFLKAGTTITNALGAGMRTYPLREPVTVSESGTYVAEIHPDGTATLTRRGVAR